MFGKRVSDESDKMVLNIQEPIFVFCPEVGFECMLDNYYHITFSNILSYMNIYMLVSQIKKVQTVIVIPGIAWMRFNTVSSSRWLRARMLPTTLMPHEFIFATISTKYIH